MVLVEEKSRGGEDEGIRQMLAGNPGGKREDGRKRRSLATIKLIKTFFVLQAAYGSSHASANGKQQS